MKSGIFIFVALFFGLILSAQESADRSRTLEEFAPRHPDEPIYQSQEELTSRTNENLSLREKQFPIIAADFVIVDSEGNYHRLYSTLESGKTVFIELFFTSCSYCQAYSPIIEEIYQDYGSGQENVVFWGISNKQFDTDQAINQFKEDYGVNFPMAGIEGGGAEAHEIIVEGNIFTRWPTYILICPDKSIVWDPHYPPTADGFDQYIDDCSVLDIDEGLTESTSSHIHNIFPNPAASEATVELMVDAQSGVRLEVYNILGEIITEQAQQLSPGVNMLSLDLEGQPGGNYFVRMLQDGQYVDTQKLIIIR